MTTPEHTPEITEMIASLRARGFVVGDRDPNMNTAFEGAYMVSEAYEAGYTQEDAKGGDGVWCIVGDDLNLLVETAFRFFDDMFAEGPK